MQPDIAKKFEDIRGIFPHTKNVVYFNSASYGPFSTEIKKIIEDNIDIRLAAEQDDSHSAFSTAEELRRDLAGLIGAGEKEVGIGLNTSFGLNIAAFGLPLNAGDEILMSDIEFPAIPYTFRAASESRGLKLRYVKSTDRCFDIDEFEKAITLKSKMLAISYVQFFNGFKQDMARLSKICKEHGMYFVVDGIQGMGTEPVDVKELDIDVFTSGCQKWLMAPQGCGFFYLAERVRDTIKAPFMSWLGVDWKMNFSDLFYFDLPYYDSARRYEMGYYVIHNLLGMKASLRMFRDLGIDNIQEHNHLLIDRLADFVEKHPYYRITSDMTPLHRSSIFTFACDKLEELHKELLREKIILVRREGSIRVSVHLFNDEKDIDKLIGVLEKFAENHSG